MTLDPKSKIVGLGFTAYPDCKTDSFLAEQVISPHFKTAPVILVKNPSERSGTGTSKVHGAPEKLIGSSTPTRSKNL